MTCSVNSINKNVRAFIRLNAKRASLDVLLSSSAILSTRSTRPLPVCFAGIKASSGMNCEPLFPPPSVKWSCAATVKRIFREPSLLL